MSELNDRLYAAVRPCVRMQCRIWVNWNPRIRDIVKLIVTAIFSGLFGKVIPGSRALLRRRYEHALV